ncbi:hypothetical protein [Pedobacter sp. UBA5917]|uniref:hypothetical protein n=1 Tax=Pedobacter sp. UBA5917 TaxID=1947061 RepID=UPI0025E642E5|nr:hypothetical protein [Pedobacter sp. UBA5917]
MKRVAISIGTVLFVLAGCNQVKDKLNQNTKMNRNDSLNTINISDSTKTLKTEKNSVVSGGVDLKSKIDSVVFVQNVIKYKDSIDKRLNTFVKTEFESLGGSAEGGEILTYHNKNDTLKIKAVFYGETGQNQFDFYLKNKKIIAVNETIKGYKSSIGSENVEIVIDKIKSRLYILNGNTILMADRKDRKTDFNFEQKTIDIIDVYKQILLDIRK